MDWFKKREIKDEPKYMVHLFGDISRVERLDYIPRVDEYINKDNQTYRVKNVIYMLDDNYIILVCDKISPENH